MGSTDQIATGPRFGRFLSEPGYRRVAFVLALALTLGLALGLRLYGLDWDRGYSYTPHPDERAILMKVGELAPPGLGQLGTLFDADESPWNPRWFPYGSFPLYLLKGVDLTYSAVAGEKLHDLRTAARLISALADVGSVLFVYLLAGRAYGRREALLASFLLAIAVIHIQLSHFFAVDTILALSAVAALFFMYRVAKEGRLRDSLLAGAFIGLGVATKVSLAPIYIALVMAHLLFSLSPLGGEGGAMTQVSDRTSRAFKGLVAGVALSVAVFFVVQPYAFLDWSRFYGDVIEQSEMVRRIRDYPYTRQYIDTTPYLYQARQLATWGLGWPLGIVAWAGLLYASLRGMRPSYGVAYLLLGYAVPGALLVYSLSFPYIVVASGIAFAALVATLPVRSPESRGGVILLSWVVPYLLITGAFQVKFSRYLLPITPLLLVMGSAMLVALWDRARERRPAMRLWLAAGLVFLLGATGFYALSYMSIYQEPHPAVRTASWIKSNAPADAIILKEHWEEGIPNLHGYEIRELPLYNNDGSDKLRQLSGDLAEADYIWFYSNRLYGTIPRLQERYPFSAQYYSLLFAGELGYELVDVETSYPRLAGVSLVHDTFGRPGLPEPVGLSSLETNGLALDLGFADESFSVYDHPTGLVFQNVARLDASSLRRTIEDAGAGTTGAQPAVRQAAVGLLLSPEEARERRENGTWSEIVADEGLPKRLPVLAWLIVVEGIALLAVPLSFVIFRPLADRGYLFSKAVGLLVVGLVAWLLASFGWVPFSQGSIALGVTVLFAGSAWALYRRHREIVEFVRRRWSLLLIAELVFLAAFFSFLLLRMANPDLWHPYRGGEKPMDMAYLNAVLRSSYMPPYDPWFGGGYLNYYYWGQFMVATLIRATGIAPQIAVNLAVPLFFAMTVAGAYSVVYNLAEGTRRWRRGALAASGPDGDPGGGTAREEGQGRWSPVAAGMAGAVFVTVIGNLDGAIQVGQGVWRSVFQSAPFGEFDFWRSTRMMAPDPPGFEINEFPFFTFLFADPHAHLLALPFTLLALGLALSVVMGALRDTWRRTHGSASSSMGSGELLRLAALGVVVGSLWAINAWDFPTYMLMAGVAVFIAAYFSHGGLSLLVVMESVVKTALVFLVGYVVFLPFHLNYQTFFSSLETTTNQTVLWQFLAISGLFIFIIGSFFISESRGWLRALTRLRLQVGFVEGGSVSGGLGAPLAERDPVLVGVLRFLITAAVVGVLAYAVWIAASRWTGSTIPFLVVLGALGVVVGLRYLRSMDRDAPLQTFVVAMVLVPLALAIGLDIFRVEGDIDRMNSVFKFYLQIWVLLAVSSAYMLWRLADGRKVSWSRIGLGKKVWVGALVALILSASVYPILGTKDRLRDRFNERATALTLNGTHYIEGTVYHDREGDIDLGADYEGISWLLEKVEGSPVVLEAQTPTYRWGGRVSVHTGLPTVVGWKWHQEQQRWDYRWAVDQRIQDVNRIYRTTSVPEALFLLDQYDVEYVYVGQVERLYYPEEGLKKFDGGMEEHLDQVFESDQVQIYRVKRG